MENNFGGRDLFNFGVIAPFACVQKQPKFPFGPWAIVHGCQKIELAQKIHVSGGQLEMHGKQFWWA